MQSLKAWQIDACRRIFKDNADTLSEIRSTLENVPSPWTKATTAGIASFLADIYAGVEHLGRMIVENVVGDKLEHGRDNWHKELLSRMVFYGLVPDSIAEEMDNARKFRHYEAKNYAVRLSEYKIREVIPEMTDMYHRFRYNFLELYPEIIEKQLEDADQYGGCAEI